MLNSQVAGGQISSAAISEGGISFDYTFSAPVAIGASLQYIEAAPKVKAAAGAPLPQVISCPGPMLAAIEPPAQQNHGPIKGKPPHAAARAGTPATVAPDKSGPQLHIGSEVSPGIVRTLANQIDLEIPNPK